MEGVMVIDWTLKVTDIIMITAIFLGPIVAVQVTEVLRKRNDARDRRVRIFRTLMATRSATLAPQHVEALNLVEIEFHGVRKVIDDWRLYLAHLNDRQYPTNAWPARRIELLTELLYGMSASLGYAHDKSQLRAGVYYPAGYENTEAENAEMRKLFLEVLRGRAKLPVSVTQAAPLPPAAAQAGPQAAEGPRPQGNPPERP
jgi:uncharacterized protein DUF6680